jgi:hypothetical protein
MSGAERPLTECVAIRDRMSALLDGELDPAGVSEVEAHLGECAACRREFEDLQATLVEFRQAARSVPEPPPWDAVEQRLSSSRQAAPPGWWPVAAAAVVILALVLVPLAVRHVGAPTPALTLELPVAFFDELLDPSRVEQVEPERLVQTAGFAPLAPQQLPGGFHRESCSVVSTADCRLVTVRYRRGDDVVALLQHAVPAQPSCARGGFCQALGGINCPRGRVGDVDVVQSRAGELILTLASRLTRPEMGQMARFLGDCQANPVCSPQTRSAE